MNEDDHNVTPLELAARAARDGARQQDQAARLDALQQAAWHAFGKTWTAEIVWRQTAGGIPFGEHRAWTPGLLMMGADGTGDALRLYPRRRDIAGPAPRVATSTQMIPVRPIADLATLADALDTMRRYQED